MEKLDEQLNCSICLDTYTDPKLLQCFHTYCTKCLIPLVRDEQGQLILTCPTCRQVTPLPPNGVRDLQSAFHINDFIEIRDDLKKAKDPISSLESGVEDDATISTPPKKMTHYCSEHDKELELYCETCNELICWKCAVRSGKHHDHDYDPLNEAFEKYKEEITSSLEPMEKQLKSIHTALANLSRCSREISSQQATVEASIHDTTRQLHEVLRVRETELIDQLYQMTQRKLKSLASQRDQMETIQARIDSCLGFIDGSLKTNYSQGEVLTMKTTIVKQVKELTTPIQPYLLKPNTEADITFSAPPNITDNCKQYGMVFSSESPDPSQCHVTGKGLEVAVVGERSSFTLQAIKYNGAPCNKLIVKSLKCELVSEITHATVRVSLESRVESQYTISYQPTIKGRHQLRIKVEDQHIRGSPYSLAVTSPVEKLGTPIITIGGVKGPCGMAFNQKGEMVVCEWNGDCISTFSPDGEKVRSFGTSGSGPGQFKYPCGIAVDGEGNILVADSNNHRIQRFTSEGLFIASVSTGDENYKFYLPYGITFNHSNNKVYVVDCNHCVTVLNSDLSFFSSFGKYGGGSGKGQFNYPYDVACDSTGKVYVADRNNHRIQVFTAEGKFLKMFGNRGDGRGELNCPISITTDTSDRVYVGDYNHRISVFTPDGQFHLSFSNEGMGPGEFQFPHGLRVDAIGVVYVCDFSNNRIQLF